MANWVCTSCGGENPEGMKFCGHCGTPAAPAPPAPEPPDVLRPFVSAAVANRLTESGGEIGEERRLITALFADISGFTALAQRVDTEELLEIVDPIVSRLSSIVGRYDGYVEKFAGDALLALFGAPVTHEDDAERALTVALEMHEELARIREELPDAAAGLTLHVGINSGHGIARILGSEARMDYAVLGDSVILAQRLESQAPTGETYVGATTVHLARGRFVFEPVGEPAVKGKVEPVPAWRLLGPAEPTTAGAPWIGAGPVRLLGRDGEIALLADRVGELRDGRGGSVAILDESGVGKSTLVAAWRADAHARGVRWLDTRCLSYGSALAYRPFAEPIRGYAGIRLDDRPEAAAPALADALRSTESLAALPYFARTDG
jgi:class 3 adenylate cyclase